MFQKLQSQIAGFLMRRSTRPPAQVPPDVSMRPGGAESITHCLELESRILYSAAPVDLELLEPVGSMEDLPAASATALPNNLDWLTWPVEYETLLDGEFLQPVEWNADPTGPVNEIVFISDDVDQYLALKQSILQVSPHVDIFILDSTENGIARITEVLAGYRDLAAIHFITHGSDGRVGLGNVEFGLHNVAGYAGQISSWGDALSANADLMFYGCDLAATETGQEFIQSLGELTATDIGSSDDKTGHANLGGDWDLEYHYGQLESSIIVAAAFRDAWHSTLATTATDDSYAINADGTLIVPADGLLANDVIDLPEVVPGASLEFSAYLDSDGNQIWEDSTGLTDYDFDFSGTSVVRDGSVSDSLPGLRSAYVFDGSGGGIMNSRIEDLPGDPTNNSASFEFWLRPSDAIGTEIILDVGNSIRGVSLRLNGGQLEWVVSTFAPIVNYVAVATQDISAEIASGQFIHIVASIDLLASTPTASIVVNGGPAATGTHPNVGDWSAGSDAIGLGQLVGSAVTLSPSGADPFEGEVSTFRFYEFVLDSAQIQQNYEAVKLSITAADTTSSAGASVTVAPDGSFVYDPGSLFDYLASGETAIDTFSYTVDDAQGNSDTATVSITITGVNDAPTVNDQTFTIGENLGTGSPVGSIFAVDPDNGSDGSLMVAVTGGTGAAAFAVDSAGNITVADSSLLNFEATSTLTLEIEITDGGGLTDTATITIQLTDENDAPVLNSDGGADTADLDLVENTTLVTTVTAVDEDQPGDSLTFLLTGGADQSLFSIDSNTGVLTFNTPTDFEAPLDADANNTYEVEVTVEDGNGGSDSQLITVTIIDVNEAPTTTGISDLIINEDPGFNPAFDLAAAFDDAEDLDSELVYTVVGITNPALFDSITINGSNQIVVDFADDQHGLSLVTVRATDTGGLYVETTFQVVVNPVNDSPVVNDQSFLIDENTPNGASVGFVVAHPGILDSPDSITGFVITGGTGAGFFNINATTGEITVSNSSGLDFESTPFLTLMVQVTDAGSPGLSDTATITINLNDLNDVQDPVLVNNVLTIDEGQSVILNSAMLSATDGDDPDTSLVFNVSGVDGGQFERTTAPGTAITNFTQSEVVSGLVLFRDDGDEFGPGYQVSVTDGSTTSGPLAASVSFTNVNDAPRGGEDRFAGPVGSLLTGAGLLMNDFDAEGSPLAASLNTVPSNGSVVVNSDGTFVYTPNDGFSGTDSFTYLVSDGVDSSGAISVVVEIIAAAPAPAPASTTSTTESETETSEDIVIVPPPESAANRQEGGADVKESSSIPLVAISYANQQPAIETVGQIEVANKDYGDAKIAWNSGISAASLEALEGLSRVRNGAAEDLLDESGWFWRALDKSRGRMEAEANLPQVLLGSTAAIASTITVGYLIWLVNGGKILAAVVASLPTWSLVFDPLPILNVINDEDDADDESLESIIKNDEERKSNSTNSNTPATA